MMRRKGDLNVCLFYHVNNNKNCYQIICIINIYPCPRYDGFMNNKNLDLLIEN